MKLFIIAAFVLILGTITGVYFVQSNSNNTSIPSVRTVKIDIPENINYSKINQEVIELERQYFNISDKPLKIEQISLQQNNDSTSIILGQWSLTAITGEEEIQIDNKYVRNPEVYRAVFTHEYIHHILYLMNFSDSNDINEGLTEAFVWYTNKEIQARLFGKNNEKRKYPYTLVMNQVFKQDNFVCLDKVFIKTDKINSVDDYKTRLKNYCNVTI